MLNKETRFRNLCEKYTTGSLTADEQKVFFRLLDEPESRQIFESILSEEWKNSCYEEVKDQYVEDRVETYVLGKISKKQLRHSFLYRYRFAAAATIIFIISTVGWLLMHKVKSIPSTVAVTPTSTDIEPGMDGAILTLSNGIKIILDTARNGLISTEGNTRLEKSGKGLTYKGEAVSGDILYNTLTTPKGRQFNVTLPDGSNVWLNAASSLRYPTSFQGNNRRVEITGEAFITVTKDRLKPFIVSVNDMEIEVLGTTFNVNAYDDESTIKTSLLEGKVKVITTKKPGNVIQLLPGQQAVYDKAGNFSLDKKADLEEAVAWKNGYFKFNDADLNQVLRQAARWYDIEIVTGNLNDDDRYRGTISRDVKLSEFLKILELNKVKFILKNRTLVLNP